MTVTNPRRPNRQLIEVNWQSAKGTAASTSTAVRILCEQVSVKRNRQSIHPDGTTGYITPIDSEFEGAIQPTASLLVHAGALQMAPFLESLLGGQNTVTNSQLTEANDGGAQLSNWALTGVRPGFNTDNSWKLYVDVTAGTPITVEVYSDSGRSALVASGTKASSGTLTLAEQNNSGLSGTVDVAAVPGSNDTDIDLTIDEITFAVANEWSRYFTLWRETGGECIRLTDCVVHRVALEVAANRATMYRIDIAAMAYDVLSSTFSSGETLPGGVDFLSFSNGVIRSDLDGSPITETPRSVAFEIVRDLDTVFGPSSTPTALIPADLMARGSLTLKPSDESDAIFDRAVADSWDSVDMTFTRSSQKLKFVFDKLKFLDTEIADFARPRLADVQYSWVAVQDTSSPSTPMVAITASPAA